MKKYIPVFCRSLFTLGLLLSFVFGWAQVSITNTTAISDPLSSFQGTSATAPTNWTFSGNTTYNGTAQTTGSPGGWYGNGNISFLGSGSASNGNATWLLQNNTGATITGFTLSFVAKMWKSGSASPNVTVSYGTSATSTNPNAGALANPLSSLTFNDATASISVGTTLSQTVTGLSIPNGQYIFVRFIHAGGSNSDNLGWDDVTFTAATTATFTSTATGGDWNAGSTWVGGTVPSAGATVNIVGPVNINNSTGQISNTGIININNSGTLKCGYAAGGASLTGSGTVNVNGTGILSVEQGGWPGTTNTYNYGTTGTLQFNNGSGSYGVNSGDTWFPATIPNVNVLGAGGITVNSAHTISTLLQASAPITTASNLTVNGTFQINSTAATLSNAINYGAASTLVYNTGGTMARGNEWDNSPANVTLQNNTTLNYPNGWGNITRTITGNLTINSGSALYMDYGSPSAGVGLLTVGGNVALAGFLTLGNKVGGDLAVGGNWTNTGTSNFYPKGRAVIFNGTGTQTITNTNTAGETFNYLIINKTAGTVKLANNVTVNGSSGSVLQLINAGIFDLNGNSLTLSNNSGNILVDGAARALTSTVSGSTLNITGTKTVAATNGGSLIIAQNITTILTSGLDFGTDLTTVQGTLQIKAGGYVNTNTPKYASTSTLEYNGVTGYNVNTGWSAATGTIGTTAGFPQNVLLTSSSINMPNSNRGLAGNLTIGTGSTLNMNGTSGDLYVGGHWVNSGTFNPNNRAVFFNGAAAQNLTGATTFDWLSMNNASGGLNFQASSPVIINNGLTLTSGVIYIVANNLTIPATATITGGSATSHVATLNAGAGKLVRTGVGNTDVLFPLGISGTKYSPITVKNTTGTSDLSINLTNSTFTGAVFDATQVVKMQWNITSSAATTAVVTPVWETADQGSAMLNPGTGELGNYISPNYVVYSPVSLTQFTTSASNVALQSGANYIVVGNTGGIYTAPPANDNCSGAVELTVDAAAVNGTVKAATTSAATSCGATGPRKDVWYKFTTTDAGKYAITVVGSATFDAVLDVRSGDCTTNNSVVCKDGTAAGGTELLNAYTFAANTTYFVRIFHYYTADPTDKTFTIAVTSPPPAITATPATRTFADTNVNANSADQIVSITAVFLTPANDNITVSSPSTDFEVSKDGTTWGSSATYPYTGRKLAASDLHIRFTPKTGCAKTANIAVSGGGATTVNIAVSGNAVIPAPVATAATEVSDVAFTANWNAVSGATGYALDVSTSSTFTAPDNTAVLKEGFEAGLTASYQTGNVTLSSGTWSVTNVLAGTTGVNSGTKSAQLQSATGSNLISPSLNSVSKISFYVTSSTASGALQVNYSTDGGTTWIAAPGSPFTALGTTKVQKTITLTTPTTGSTLVEFKRTAATIYLDDININYIGEKPSFVTGYENLAVTGTSHDVTGLDPNTTYYYRVPATTGGACISANSNVEEIKTGGTVTWTGTAWDNSNQGPTIKDKVIIAGDFNSSYNGGTFASRELVVNTGKNLDIPSNIDVTVKNNITNNGTIIVNSDASLVQQNKNAVNTGSITVKREARMKRLDYTFWGSPVASQNLFSFSPSTTITPSVRFYKYNEGTDMFSNTGLSSSSVFDVGTGYAVRAPNNFPATYSQTNVANLFTGTFVGEPNNGDKTVTLHKALNGYNLVSNPYPSNIDFSKLVTNNLAQIEAEAYFWTNVNANTTTTTAANYTTNNYASYIGGVGNPASGGNEMPTNIIKVGQGFIVQAKSENSVLTFDNTVRTISKDGVFFNVALKGNAVSNDRYWLRLTTPMNNTNTIAIGYTDGATDAFDNNFDAPLMIVGSDSFYSKIDDKKLAIQARQYPLVNTDKFPLGIKAFEAGIHSISIWKKEGTFANGQPIYLHDKTAGTYTNLQNGNYSFNTAAGIDENRFEIVYETQTVLGTDIVAKSAIQIYRNGNNFVVKAPQNIEEVQVFEISGKLISVSKPNGRETVYDASAIANGTYLIKVKTRGGEITSKKVIK